MVKVISQETFDAVVKENVEEFGMQIEEARKDAIQQFQSQGVDLSNIITETHKDQPHAVVTALDHLVDLIELEENEQNTEAILKELKVVEDECKIDLARRILTEKNGGFDKIMKCLQKFNSNPTLKNQCLQSLAALTEGYPDVLTVEGTELLTEILDEECPLSIVTFTLSVVSNCCKMHERNREAFVTRFRLAAKIRRVLETPPTRNQTEIVIKCCQLIRTIVADDDVRVEFGRAHEYACIIAEQENALEILTSLLAEFQSDHAVVSEILQTLSRLAVRNEFCQRIVEFGALRFVIDLLVNYYDDKDLIEKSLFLIKALAGNDDVKREVAKAGGIPLIVAALDRHKSIPVVAEMGCAAMAALCLRVPENAADFVANSAAPLLVDILKNHRLKVSVERQASMAIRNMVSRRKDLAPAFLAAGAEELLQNAIKRSQRAPTNEIKAALRDLGCKIHLQELWTGTGANVTN